MMARHGWSLLCERAILDADSGELTLVAITEDLVIEMEPLKATELAAVPVQLSLASSWRRDDDAIPERAECRFEVISPAGLQLAQSRPMEIRLDEDRRVHTIGRIEFLPVDSPGTYDFVIQHRAREGAEWSDVGRVSIRIEISAPLVGVGGT